METIYPKRSEVWFYEGNDNFPEHSLTRSRAKRKGKQFYAFSENEYCYVYDVRTKPTAVEYVPVCQVADLINDRQEGAHDAK